MKTGTFLKFTAAFVLLVFLVLNSAAASQTINTEWMSIRITGPGVVSPGEEVTYIFDSQRHTNTPGYPWGTGDIMINGNLELLLSDTMICNQYPDSVYCLNYQYPGKETLRLRVRPETPPGTIITMRYAVLWERECSPEIVRFCEIYDLLYEFDDVTKVIKVAKEPDPVPEFPGTVVPGTMIAGCIATVLCLRRLK